MAFQCIYCKKRFTSKSILKNHQKSAKYCLKIQEETDAVDEDENDNKYICEYCNKSFTSNFRFQQHLENCLSKYKYIAKNKEEEFKSTLQKKDEEIDKLKTQSNKLCDELKNIAYETEIRVLRESTINDELQSKLHDIAIKAIEQKNEVITNMVKKYVKKQPRKQYDCSNVIYIITTSSLKNDRRYILGKAKNLTNRLSTYNKSDEHEVIFYQDCEDEEAMNAMEPFIFKKLNNYREQANRERFILPKDKNIDFFIDIIKNCFEFLK